MWNDIRFRRWKNFTLLNMRLVLEFILDILSVYKLILTVYKRFIFLWNSLFLINFSTGRGCYSFLWRGTNPLDQPPRSKHTARHSSVYALYIAYCTSVCRSKINSFIRIVNVYSYVHKIYEFWGVVHTCQHVILCKTINCVIQFVLLILFFRVNSRIYS